MIISLYYYESFVNLIHDITRTASVSFRSFSWAAELEIHAEILLNVHLDPSLARLWLSIYSCIRAVEFHLLSIPIFVRISEAYFIYEITLKVGHATHRD